MPPVVPVIILLPLNEKTPIAVLVPTLAILLVAGSPFLRLEQGVPGAEIYPPGVESRDAYVALQTEFAGQ